MTSTALDGLHLFSRRQALMLFGLSVEECLREGRLYQLLTAPLMHADLLHLGFNMLTLWWLGPWLERELGRRRYVWFSIVCALSASAGFILVGFRTQAVFLGYSGVILGVLMGLALLCPYRRVYVFGLFPMKMKAAMAVFGAIELYLTLTSTGGAANAAHLFGAAGAWFYLRWLRVRRPMVAARVRS